MSAQPSPPSSSAARPRQDRPSFDTSAPFTVHVAREAGLTAYQLSGPRFRRVHRGVYVARSVPDTQLLRARAALALAPPMAALGLHDAAHLWGGVVPESTVSHVWIPPRPRWRGPRGVLAHVDLQARKAVLHQGIRVTTPEQTFVDMAAYLALVDLVALGDSLVHAKVTTAERLQETAAAGRFRGVRLARQAAGLVRPGVRSGPESRLRMLIVLAGLPEPTVDLTRLDGDGVVIYRCDLGWREIRVAVEYDGRHHAESPQQWGRDIVRREDFDDNGWRVVVVRSEGLWVSPEETLARIVKVREAQGAPPVRLSHEWRRHFPGRAGKGRR